jgi:hypothetical protein
MSGTDDVLAASIDELMDTFRSALLALVPVADRAKLGWADRDTHRDWERLAACAFDTFVRGPISADRDWDSRHAPVARYDLDASGYGEVSWIGEGDSSSPGRAVVRLLSTVEPFDTVQVVEVDCESDLAGERRSVRWDECRFFLVRRSAGPTLEIVTSVVAEE